MLYRILGDYVQEMLRLEEAETAHWMLKKGDLLRKFYYFVRVYFVR